MHIASLSTCVLSFLILVLYYGLLIWWFSWKYKFVQLKFRIWYCNSVNTEYIFVNIKSVSSLHLTKTVKLQDFSFVLFSTFFYKLILIKFQWMLILRRGKLSMTLKVIKGHKRSFLCYKNSFFEDIFLFCLKSDLIETLYEW